MDNLLEKKKEKKIWLHPNTRALVAKTSLQTCDNEGKACGMIFEQEAQRFFFKPTLWDYHMDPGAQGLQLEKDPSTNWSKIEHGSEYDQKHLLIIDDVWETFKVVIRRTF